ncbi:MAG: allophanate hydrolase subunit 1 [Dermatophilaceae bacterium]|nr:allophanate hydrolase subunit 1 [Dermatophilaceae bacterium]MBU9943012.1 allophanate hydrolase subunit 1 [Dermatophilaceae bacterium]
MTRYTNGGDEHLFVELSQEMSLQAFFAGSMLTAALRRAEIEGITEICPANASFLVRFDPDRVSAAELQSQIEQLEAGLDASSGVIGTRIVEIPVLYDDPWTRETQARFRDRHQDPTSTDLGYAARVNGYGDEAAFIEAHSATPWFVSMVGFVAGLPFMYQMVERDQQLQVPKYLRPRTDTPKLTVGYGGCFTCIYSVRGAGGYQMFGVTPVPIYDPAEQVKHLRDFMIFFQPGDIVKFRAIDRDEYDRIVTQVDEGQYQLRTRPVDFSIGAFEADPRTYARGLCEVLNVR